MTEKRPEANRPSLGYPEWVTFECDRTIVTITRDDKGGYHVKCDGTADVTEYFRSLKEAYNWAIKKDYLVVIDDAARAGYESIGGMVFDNDADERGTKQLFLTHDMQLYIDIVKDSFDTFLKLDRAWRRNKNSFFHAYQWLNHHPAYWTRFEKMPWSWETEEGMMHVSMYVYKKTAREVSIVLETGIPEMPRWSNIKFFDPTLTVKAPTYEQAIIALARKIDSEYGITGEPRKPRSETDIEQSAFVE